MLISPMNSHHFVASSPAFGFSPRISRAHGHRAEILFLTNVGDGFCHLGEAPVNVHLEFEWPTKMMKQVGLISNWVSEGLKFLTPTKHGSILDTLQKFNHMAG